MTIRVLHGFRNLLRRFTVQTAGVAAVEFALILPVLAVLYLGSVELTNALTVNRKMSQVASTVGDLISQFRNLDGSTLDDIFTASEAIMTPYSDTGLVISVAGIEIDEDGDLSVDWSRTNAGGSATALISEVPDALKIPDSYVIVAKTEYTYNAVFANFSNHSFGKTTFNLDDVFFLRPRVGSSVNFTP